MNRVSRRTLAGLLALTLAAGLASLVLADNESGKAPAAGGTPVAGETPAGDSRGTTPAAITAKVPLLAAAGDVACSPADPNFNGGSGTARFCAQRRTSDLLLRRPYDAVLALGDLQYEYPSESGADFNASYGPTWGRLLDITRPVPGNHEYDTPEAAAYFDYFGDRAGPRGRGWYRFRAGSWEAIVLNSTCLVVGCGRGSRQLRWLQRQLRARRTRCTLALLHSPRFSSGPHGKNGPDRTIAWLWRGLYRAGVDLVLSGHDHFYERFAPQRPNGRLDRRRGITEIVVGTGGRSLYRFVEVRPNSRSRHRAFGVLSLRLGPRSFRWRFLAAPDGEVLDAGRRACH